MKLAVSGLKHAEHNLHGPCLKRTFILRPVVFYIYSQYYELLFDLKSTVTRSPALVLICKETEPQTFVSLTLLWVTACDFLKILLRMKLPPPVGISVPRNHSFTTGLHRKKEPGKPADRKSATNEQSGWETDSRAHHRKAGRQTAWGGRLQRERTAGMFSYHTSVHGTSTPLTAALPCAQSSQTAVLAV